jgi:hypothetical protein
MLQLGRENMHKIEESPLSPAELDELDEYMFASGLGLASSPALYPHAQH